MKKLVVYLMTFLVTHCFAQNIEVADEAIEGEYFQINYNSRKYEKINDSLFIMRQYYQNGNLYIEAEMKKGITTDTTFIEDVFTGEMRMTVCQSEGYIYDGKYKLFKDSENGKLLTEGQYANSKPVGQWKTCTGSATSDVHYDQNGRMTEFKSYFDCERTKLKTMGRYCEVEVKTYFKENGEGEYTENIVRQMKPCFTWEHYDMEGNVVEKISYEYVNWK